MRIEELPPVQKILNRIQDIESLANRFVKETPVQNRQEPFDSMLKAEGEKSASNPKIEPWRTNSRGNWEGIEPTLAEIIRKESEKIISILPSFKVLLKPNPVLKPMRFLRKVRSALCNLCHPRPTCWESTTLPIRQKTLREERNS